MLFNLLIVHSGQVIDWLIDWLNDWLIDWLNDWLVDWLIDYSDWLIDSGWLISGLHKLMSYW